MWIALGIVGFLAVLITVILLLPVRVIVYNDANNILNLRYKFLFKTFGEDPDPDNAIVNALLSATGADRLDTKKVQTSIRSSGLKKTVTDSYTLLVDLLKEVVALLRLCTVAKLQVTIRCAGDGADEVAILYGECCAATHGLVNLLRSFFKVRKKGMKIDIGCDFTGDESTFFYHVELVTRVHRVLRSLWRVVWAEAQRTKARQGDQPK